ncbi:ferrochelatase [Paramylibacter kogurei]|nr:ferrochelatase [Amylibacter kogurei]
MMPIDKNKDRLAFAGKDHPAIKPAKIGVVLANLGTPDATDYWSMRRYLGQFLSDKRVVDIPNWKWQPILQLIILSKRPFSAGKAYQSIWNTDRDESPLLTITRDQCDAVAAQMAKIYGEDVIVDFAMRYGNPSVESVINKMRDQGVEKIVFFPLYPQYAAPTTATANDEAFRALMKLNWQPAVRTVPAYYDHPKYINALKNSVQMAYETLAVKPDLLVASYHGMPKRYLMEGDPYHCQCQKTTRLLKEALDWSDDDITTTFQSVFGREEWLRPYTVEHVAELARQGKKNIAVISPAFSADCIETLEEIQEEIQDAFKEAGGETFTYIPCLNDNADHLDMMTDIIQNELSGWI